MRKLFLSCLTLLALVVPCWGQTVTIPAEVKVPTGRLGSVLVSYDGTDFKYITPPDIDCFREYDPDPKRIKLRLIGYAPGRYQIYAVACKDGKLSEFGVCTVIVGEVPPGPTPPPGPQPPPGPTPPPQPVPPVDPALPGLQAAFETDRVNSGNTMAHVAQLASVYREGAKAVKDMPAGATFGDFYSALAQTSKKVVPPGQLPKTKSYLGEQLDRMLPLETARQMTAGDRQLIADKMNWAADLLTQIKGKGVVHD